MFIMIFHFILNLFENILQYYVVGMIEYKIQKNIIKMIDL